MPHRDHPWLLIFSPREMEETKKNNSTVTWSLESSHLSYNFSEEKSLSLSWYWQWLCKNFPLHLSFYYELNFQRHWIEWKTSFRYRTSPPLLRNWSFFSWNPCSLYGQPPRTPRISAPDLTAGALLRLRSFSDNTSLSLLSRLRRNVGENEKQWIPSFSILPPYKYSRANINSFKHIQRVVIFSFFFYFLLKLPRRLSF